MLTAQGADMGSTVAFDTHALVKRLKAAGFTEQQAEAQTEALMEIANERLATKQDVLSIRQDMREMELRLTIKRGGIIVAEVAAMGVIAKLL